MQTEAIASQREDAAKLENELQKREQSLLELGSAPSIRRHVSTIFECSWDAESAKWNANFIEFIEPIVYLSMEPRFVRGLPVTLTINLGAPDDEGPSVTIEGNLDSVSKFYPTIGNRPNNDLLKRVLVALAEWKSRK